jgi:hypothetical protein
VELLERVDDRLGLVAEVEYERALFERTDAVETGQRLNGSEPHQNPVHVHGAQQRLVEAGLELLRHDQDPYSALPNSSATQTTRSLKRPWTTRTFA